MTTVETRPTPAARSRVWAWVLAWALIPDNARLDFAAIGAFNGSIGVVLLLLPGLQSSPSLAILFQLVPRMYWALAFLGSGVLVMAGLRSHSHRRAARLRHAAWAGCGTLMVMWLAGVFLAGGSATSVLVLTALLVWYSLTLARLELPRLLLR